MVTKSSVLGSIVQQKASGDLVLGNVQTTIT
jgi:hypothetical protein